MSDRSQHASNATPWQSLDHLAGTLVDNGESINGTSAGSLVDSAVSRRGFMTIMGASMALTAAACRRPEQKLIAAVESKQVPAPGLPVDYATVYSHRNVAYGALVKSREGRPIKVKGNELHPSNCGTSSAEMQATLLSLYDPDRLRRPRVSKSGGAATYENAVSKIASAVTEAAAAGKKAVVLIDEHCSPSFTALMTEITTAVPNMSFVMMPSIVSDNAAIANKAVLGIDGELVPDLGKAKVIVSVDADPLGTDKLALHHTGRYAARRTPTSKSPSMSLLIVAEAQYSLTGANADERVRLHPSQIEAYLGALEAEIVGSAAIGGKLAAGADAATKTAAQRAAVALKAAPGEAVVLAGRHLSPLANAVALNISNALGSVGYGLAIDPAHVLPNSGAKKPALDMLVNDLNAGAVHALVFCGVNPEYAADRAFRTAMIKAPVRAAINLYEDETAVNCSISIPGSHWLESWGDAIAYDGTLSVQQPLIAPMNEGVASTCDTLMSIAKKVNGGAFAGVDNYYTYVMNRWAGLGDWRKTLQDGVLKPTAPTTMASTVQVANAASLPAGSVATGRVVMTVPSLALYDGQLSNNAWLQELPDPVTKITWENVALISPNTAVAMGIASALDAKSLRKANGHIVTVATANGSIDLPTWVQPGMADDVVAVSLGYGRTACGVVANGVGANAYTVANSGAAVGYAAAKNITVTDAKPVKIACTQDHHTLDDGNGERPVAKWVSAGDVAHNDFSGLSEHFPNAGEDGKFLKPLSITQDYDYKGHRWGMVIDMSQCTGCSSCIVACQSENNIHVVGKEQVALGREMHWMRLDRYYMGDVTDPSTIVEPMLCQHCENAPCENVCPVAATTHSPEGLNEMTYNRCVGTRYCLNNCPYKVRRFNFLNYQKEERSPLDLVFNPDVTVRMRGVMEKCTFCVQRLHEAKWHARDAGRARVNDGEAITACQEACPAGAIIFGDTNDPNSRVSKARMGERGFRVLSDLNVRPQVTYLAKVRNVKDSSAKKHH